jgi:hypothetical protein
MLRALGHLAARELGIARTDAAPSLAPRLPSRYEPVEAAPLPSADADGPSDAARPPVVDTPSARLAAASERIDATRDSDVERPAIPEESVSSPVLIVREARGPAPQPEFAPRTAAVASARPPARAAAREPAATVAPLASPRTTEPVRGDREPPLRDRDDAPRALPPSQPRANTPAREATVSVREGATLRPVLPPRMPARSTVPAVAAPIHVTIGRIEIRAAKEAAAEPVSGAHRTNSPSLAAYLRRRSEGGRS